MGACKSKPIQAAVDGNAVGDESPSDMPKRRGGTRTGNSRGNVSTVTTHTNATVRASNAGKGNARQGGRTASSAPGKKTTSGRDKNTKYSAQNSSSQHSNNGSKRGRPPTHPQRAKQPSESSKLKEKGGQVLRLSFGKGSNSKLSDKGEASADGSSELEGSSAFGAQHERQDPQWVALFEAARSRIIDPADMHSVIEERIAETVNMLSPVEIVFIQRRSRSIMRAILASSSGGGSGGSTMNAMMGRLNIGSSGAVDEDGKSRIICQKENVMDENLFRKVFDGAGRYLKEGFESDVSSLSRAAYRQRRARTAENTNMGNEGEELLLAALGKQTATFPESTPNGQINSFSQKNTMAAGRSNKQYVGMNGKKNGKHNTQKGEQYSRSLADPIGAAYTLLLHLSEGRWEYAAAVATISAKRAGLKMDVNHLIKDEDNDSVAARQQALTPPPPPKVPTAEAYGSDELSNISSSNASGISFEALCFIVAMALRGTRQQKLVLLFYLLGPPSQLAAFLARHPAGGIPSWILEIGSETILSYASLAHYYYYDIGGLPQVSKGALSREGSDRTAATNASTQSELRGKSNQPRRLGVYPTNVIDTISILLTDSLENDSGAAFEISLPKESTPNKPSTKRRDRGAEAPSSGTSLSTSGADSFLLGKDDCDAGCGDLMGYLRLAREGQITFSEDIILGNETGIIDRFWDASASFYTAEDDVAGTGKMKSTGAELSWSLADFISWAELALDDEALDIIMFRLFGTGVLPSPRMEQSLVERRWFEWQQKELQKWTSHDSQGGKTDLPGVQRPLSLTGESDNAHRSTSSWHKSCAVWGGMGGIDGGGGLGYGLMTVIDKRWWDKWVSYTGWKWHGAEANGALATTSEAIGAFSIRPRQLSSERLLDRESDSFVPGTLGSYEVMKSDLKKDFDYVLVPCRVWDILYELYGGGPMLIRMVSPPNNDSSESLLANMNGSKNPSVEVVALPSTIDTGENLMTIPRSLQVVTHPWVVHCHACDPHQPYRRGDAGPLSIRVMAMPDQPLWRLVAEIVLRLPVHYGRAKDSSGQGRARLWKRIDPATLKDSSPGACRYGPWALLCKSRFAKFPVKDGNPDEGDYLKEYQDDWQTYADHGSVESVGLSDGAKLMFEFAILGKGGGFTWPREAAAKAGRMRRVADEDAAFRRTLRGIDEHGKAHPGPSPLIGEKIDALDSSGRWYQAEILQVDRGSQVSDDEDSVTNPDDTPVQENEGNSIPGENKLVRVDFSDQSDHEEWIDVNSDRLAVAGRFTIDSVRDINADPPTNDGNGSNSTHGETKPRLSVPGRKNKEGSNHESAVVETSSGSVSPYPGYGACGLTNLGNTCYANSALQCISYMPLLRSYLLSGQYKINGDLNKDNPLGTGGRLLEEFADLLRIMWSGKYGSRAPTRFRSQLGKARSQYSGADQQDAQELLNDMLDVLHEDSNKVKKKPYVEALEDDWVKKNQLPRVGQEAWRRFLRRNRSVVANVAMGQVLNRVTCPVCHHSSTNFDPFNMLSIPFPTVAEVIFRCTVVRRGTTINCKSTLRRTRFEHKSERDDAEVSPPSTHLIFEQYVIAMSRLADIGDLKLRLQNISGIPANRLKLCKSEEIVVNADADKSNPTRTYVKVSALPDKEGPCVQLAKQSSASDDLSTPAVAPTHIMAFESTLHPRPPRDDSRSNQSVGRRPTDEGSREDSSTAEEDEDDDDIPENGQGGFGGSKRDVMEHLGLYGDEQECILYDTDPTPLSKAISRSLWPRESSDFKLGLRVDAIDHRDHWFPGSVVEIIEGVDDSAMKGDADRTGRDSPHIETKVRIHFDNFSSKWDETYTIDQFKRGQVRPLYSHATPRAKPTEFLVHNRHVNRSTKGNALFGQAFYLQCQNEWSTARAGAHILAQASRFLQSSRKMEKSGKTDEEKRAEELALKRFQQASEEARRVISEIIQILTESDRKYVEAALSNGKDITNSWGKDSSGAKQRRFIRSSQVFNASQMSSILSKRLSSLLPLLPFDVRVCTADSPLGAPQGGVSDEVAFPFSLVRTIGNYMNARHAVVLHWREKKSNNKKLLPLEYSILYSPPAAGVHKQSRALLNGGKAGGDASKNGQRKSNTVHGGMHLGVCLTEFCKEQHLPATDCWRCPRCKDVREGKQCMTMWRLPDLLTFHVKRFNCSARWREKITTKVNFPLTGLDMSEWCDNESPALQGPEGSCVYDLFGVVNHYGGMTGGHYVATCKATACSPDGSEEVAHNFTGTCTSESDAGVETVQSGWRLGRSKEKESTLSQAKVVAAAASRAAAESPEPLWMQFDDDLVEPIPPRNVVSEMAYVLFYRRRQISSSNIAKYCTLE